MTYRYKPYPSYRYHTTFDKEPIIVHNKKEDEALGDEWERYPTKKVEDVLEKNGMNIDDAPHIAKGIADATNALTQVTKMRSKKQVLELAFDLDIKLESKKLKDMKVELIAKAEVGGTV